MSYISDIRKKVGHDAIFMPTAGCIIIKDNKILLQRRTDNKKWAIHGGALELGETFLEAFEREVKEELNIKPINPILINIYSGNDMHFIYPNKDEVFIVAGTYLIEEYEGNIQVDNDEVSEVKWFDINKLPNNIHDVDIKPINESIDYIKSKLKS